MCHLCLDATGKHQVRDLHAPYTHIIGRRSLLTLGMGAAASLAVMPAAFAKSDKKPVPKPENVMSPDAALDRLVQGNARYIDGVSRRFA